MPKDVAWLLRQLNRAGYPAYVVGGCVRDSLLGRTPGDWDICTGALPEQTRTVFAGQRLLLTGLKHGTVAVVLAGKPYEITTFRVDGAYADHRHPDAVCFVPGVEQDLARRDFTVNAMALAPRFRTGGLLWRAAGSASPGHPVRRGPGRPLCRGRACVSCGHPLCGAAGFFH